jgi:hypothetical protein
LRCLRKSRRRNKTLSNVCYWELHRSNMDKQVFLFFCVCMFCFLFYNGWWIAIFVANVATSIATSIVCLFFFYELDLIYELMLFKWKGKGIENWIWCNELSQKAKGALEERKNYTYAIEATREAIDARDPIVDATFWHDCFCVRATTFSNI